MSKDEELHKVYLSKSGKALWDELSSIDMDPPTKTLVLQLCRLVDHLDRLDRILRSKETWISLANDGIPNDDGKIVIVMDGALTEFRQQASTLSAIMTKLGIGKLDISALSIGKVESRADEIARKRAERAAAAKDSQQSG